MKIMVITDRFPTLSETFVLDQVTGLIDRGHDVRIVSWAARGDALNDGYERYCLDDRMVGMSPHVPRSIVRRYIRGAVKLLRLFTTCPGRALRLLSPKYGKISFGLIPLYIADALRRTDWHPDAVVAHFGPNGLIASTLKNAGFIPRDTQCYTFFHAYEISGVSPQRLSKAYRPMTMDGSIFLPISELWQNKLLQAGIPSEHIHVCRMGVDIAAIPYRRRVMTPGRLRIVTVGRLVEKKAHRYSIRAVAKLIGSTDCDVQYDIIGDGPLRTELQELITSLGVGGNIHLSGAMPHSAVKEALSTADVFLLPSVTSASGDMEGIPVSLMEAMASGLICVSTYHSGIPELIDDRLTGYLCRERSVDDITGALSEIIAAPQQQIDSMTQAARAKVEHDYDRERLLDSLIDMMSSKSPSHKKC